MHIIYFLFPPIFSLIKIVCDNRNRNHGYQFQHNRIRTATAVLKNVTTEARTATAVFWKLTTDPSLNCIYTEETIFDSCYSFIFNAIALSNIARCNEMRFLYSTEILFNSYDKNPCLNCKKSKQTNFYSIKKCISFLQWTWWFIIWWTTWFIISCCDFSITKLDVTTCMYTIDSVVRVARKLPK